MHFLNFTKDSGLVYTGDFHWLDRFELLASISIVATSSQQTVISRTAAWQGSRGEDF